MVDALRRRLRGGGAEPGAPPATVPGLGSGEETAIAAAARPGPGPATEPVGPQRPAEPDAPVEPQPPAAPGPPAEPGARIDAARERLRAKIQAPADPEAD